MTVYLDDKQPERFQTDGVVVVRQLLDKHWLDVLRRGFDQNLKQPTQRTLTYIDDPKSKEHFFFDALLLGENRAYDELVKRSPMAEVIAKLMGSSTSILFYMTVFVRSAGAQTRTPWHTDQTSWSASGRQACSLWTCLDPVTRKDALEFVRGSQHWPEYRRPRFFTEGYEADPREHLPEFPDIESNRDAHDIVGWDLEPGDCLVFHGMTAHGGSGNLPAGQIRRSLSVQWLGDDSRFRLVPGGDDPEISKELLGCGVKPGEPVVSDVCPVVWPRA